jgi:hypothetical protein
MIALRLLIPLVAFLSLFMLPWQASAVLVLAAALVLPMLGVVLGAAADILYFSPHAAPVPFFFLGGAAATLLALLVHRFVKTRIMEG